LFGLGNTRFERISNLVNTFAFDHLEPKHMAPVGGWRNMTGAGHLVQFYQDDDFVVDLISRYLTHGIRVGDHCLVVLTAKHLKKVEERLEVSLRDLFQSAREDGRYTALDAHQALAQFMKGDTPDPVAVEEAVQPFIKRAGGAKTRALGEMVGLLVTQGNPKGAVELERLWNEMQYKHGFAIFCIYPIKDLAQPAASQYFSDICCNHSHVFPDETYSSLTSADERLRAIAQLQLKTLQLEMKVADPNGKFSDGSSSDSAL